MTLDLTCRPDHARPQPARRTTLGKLTGQKPALKAKEVWAIRIGLQLARKARELALFNLAIDSKHGDLTFVAEPGHSRRQACLRR